MSDALAQAAYLLEREANTFEQVAERDALVVGPEVKSVGLSRQWAARNWLWAGQLRGLRQLPEVQERLRQCEEGLWQAGEATPDE